MSNKGNEHIAELAVIMSKLKNHIDKHIDKYDSDIKKHLDNIRHHIVIVLPLLVE